MELGNLSFAEQSDIGLKRKTNQDAVLCLPQLGVFCVADGMGGVQGGGVASKRTIQAIEEALADRHDADTRLKCDAIQDALNGASRWIKKTSEEKGITGAGSTVMILLLDMDSPHRGLTLHAGDSRTYRFRGGTLQLLTRDHSVAEAAGVRNEDSLPSMFRGVITKAVGIEEQVQLEETPVDVQPGDLFLLCSDGLTKMIPDRALAKFLRLHAEDPLQPLATQLIDRVNAAGGEDNVSVVLVGIPYGTEHPSPPHTPLTETAAPTRIAHPGSQPGRKIAKGLVFLFVVILIFLFLNGNRTMEELDPRGTSAEDLSASELEARVAKALSISDGEVPESWLKTWRMIQEQRPRKTRNAHREFMEAIDNIYTCGEIPFLPPEPVNWEIEAYLRADLYCQEHYRYQQYLLDALSAFYREQRQQVRIFQGDAKMTLGNVWKFAAAGSTYDRKEVDRLAQDVAGISKDMRTLKKWLDSVDPGPIPRQQIESCPACILPEIKNSPAWDQLYAKISTLAAALPAWQRITASSNKDVKAALEKISPLLVDAAGNGSQNGIRRNAASQKQIAGLLETMNEVYPILQGAMKRAN